MKTWLFNDSKTGAGGPRAEGGGASQQPMQASSNQKPRQVLSALAKKMDAMSLFDTNDTSSTAQGGGKPSAMGNFFVALQTDLEQSLDEIKGSSAQFGAMIRDMREKSMPSAAVTVLSPEDIALVEVTKERLGHFKVVQLGDNHTCTITAVAADRVVKASEEDKFVLLEWYRATPGGSFNEIKGIKGGTYYPSADDIGARICVRASVHPVRGEEDIPFSMFAEVGPLTMDPIVEIETEQNMEHGTVRFPWLEDHQSKPRAISCGLHLSAEAVSLYSHERPPGDDPPGPATEGELIAEGPWSPDTQLVLDPCSTLLLAIQVPRVTHHTQGPAFVRKVLVCPTREMRDVIALTWRRFRALSFHGPPVEDDMEVSFQVDSSPSRRSIAKSISTALNKAAALTRVGDDPPADHAQTPMAMAAEKEEVLFRRASRSSSIQPPKTPLTVQQPLSPVQQPAAPEKPKLSRSRFEEILLRHKRAAALRRKEEGLAVKEGLRRVQSDSSIYLPMVKDSAVAGEVDPHHDSLTQIAELSSALEALTAELDKKGIQIIKLSKEVGDLSLELERTKELRVEEIKQLEEVTADRNTLLMECKTFKTMLVNAQEDAAKHAEEQKKAHSELEELAIHKLSLEDELERLTLSEQALSLKMCTNETAVTVMREEINSLQAKLAEVQQEKESERSYFVSSMQDKDQRLDKADQVTIELETQLAATTKTCIKLQEQVTALLEEVAQQKASPPETNNALDNNSHQDEQTVKDHEALVEQHEQELREREDLLKAAEEAKAHTLARLQENEEKLQKLERALDEETRRTAALLGERNSYKNKAESLSREMHRFSRGRSLDEVDGMVSKHQEIQAQLAVMKAENKRLVDENDEYRVALATSKDMLAKKSQGTAAVRALEQHSELQRVNTLLTESLNDKVLQLETQRGMNKKMVHRMNMLEKQLAKLGVTLDDDEDDDEEEDDEDEDDDESERKS